MKDDFSELETNASCYTLNSTTSIYSYRNNIRSTYTQVGGKWYKTAAQNYTNLPTNIVCFSYNDITSLNSNAEYFPIFEFIAFSLAVFVWVVVYKLISRLIKWRSM